MYDAIVVGARCAGAAVAMLLARRGHRVALIRVLATSARKHPISVTSIWERWSVANALGR